MVLRVSFLSLLTGSVNKYVFLKVPHGSVMLSVNYSYKTCSFLCCVTLCHVFLSRSSEILWECASFALSNVFFTLWLICCCWFICFSPRTEALPLPALFSSLLTKTMKCDPVAMANSFITLILNQECPVVPQAVTKHHGDLHDRVF